MSVSSTLFASAAGIFVAANEHNIDFYRNNTSGSMVNSKRNNISNNPLPSPSMHLYQSVRACSSSSTSNRGGKIIAISIVPKGATVNIVMSGSIFSSRNEEDYSKINNPNFYNIHAVTATGEYIVLDLATGAILSAALIPFLNNSNSDLDLENSNIFDKDDSLGDKMFIIGGNYRITTAAWRYEWMNRNEKINKDNKDIVVGESSYVQFSSLEKPVFFPQLCLIFITEYSSCVFSFPVDNILSTNNNDNILPPTPILDFSSQLITEDKCVAMRQRVLRGREQRHTRQKKEGLRGERIGINDKEGEEEEDIVALNGYIIGSGNCGRGVTLAVDTFSGVVSVGMIGKSWVLASNVSYSSVKEDENLKELYGPNQLESESRKNQLQAARRQVLITLPCRLRSLALSSSTSDATSSAVSSYFSSLYNISSKYKKDRGGTTEGVVKAISPEVVNNSMMMFQNLFVDVIGDYDRCNIACGGTLGEFTYYSLNSLNFTTNCLNNGVNYYRSGGVSSYERESHKGNLGKFATFSFRQRQLLLRNQRQCNCHCFQDHWHCTPLSGIAFSADNKTVYTAGAERTLLAWMVGSNFTYRKVLSPFMFSSTNDTNSNSGGDGGVITAPVISIVPNLTAPDNVLLICANGHFLSVNLTERRIISSFEGGQWSLGTVSGNNGIMEIKDLVKFEDDATYNEDVGIGEDGYIFSGETSSTYDLALAKEIISFKRRITQKWNPVESDGVKKTKGVGVFGEDNYRNNNFLIKLLAGSRTCRDAQHVKWHGRNAVMLICNSSPFDFNNNRNYYVGANSCVRFCDANSLESIHTLHVTYNAEAAASISNRVMTATNKLKLALSDCKKVKRGKDEKGNASSADLVFGNRATDNSNISCSNNSSSSNTCGSNSSDSSNFSSTRCGLTLAAVGCNGDLLVTYEYLTPLGLTPVLRFWRYIHGINNNQPLKANLPVNQYVEVQQIYVPHSEEIVDMVIIDECLSSGTIINEEGEEQGADIVLPCRLFTLSRTVIKCWQSVDMSSYEVGSNIKNNNSNDNENEESNDNNKDIYNTSATDGERSLFSTLSSAYNNRPILNNFSELNNNKNNNNTKRKGKRKASSSDIANNNSNLSINKKRWRAIASHTLTNIAAPTSLSVPASSSKTLIKKCNPNSEINNDDINYKSEDNALFSSSSKVGLQNGLCVGTGDVLCVSDDAIHLFDISKLYYNKTHISSNPFSLSSSFDKIAVNNSSTIGTQLSDFEHIVTLEQPFNTSPLYNINIDILNAVVSAQVFDTDSGRSQLFIWGMISDTDKDDVLDKDSTNVWNLIACIDDCIAASYNALDNSYYLAVVDNIDNINFFINNYHQKKNQHQNHLSIIKSLLYNIINNNMPKVVVKKMLISELFQKIDALQNEKRNFSDNKDKHKGKKSTINQDNDAPLLLLTSKILFPTSSNNNNDNNNDTIVGSIDVFSKYIPLNQLIGLLLNSLSFFSLSPSYSLSLTKDELENVGEEILKAIKKFVRNVALLNIRNLIVIPTRSTLSSIFYDITDNKNKTVDVNNQSSRLSAKLIFLDNYGLQPISSSYIRVNYNEEEEKGEKCEMQYITEKESYILDETTPTSSSVYNNNNRTLRNFFGIDGKNDINIFSTTNKKNADGEDIFSTSEDQINKNNNTLLPLLSSLFNEDVRDRSIRDAVNNNNNNNKNSKTSNFVGVEESNKLLNDLLQREAFLAPPITSILSSYLKTLTLTNSGNNNNIFY